MSALIEASKAEDWLLRFSITSLSMFCTSGRSGMNWKKNAAKSDAENHGMILMTVMMSISSGIIAIRIYSVA